jgi:putative ABC transport system permease protein
LTTLGIHVQPSSGDDDGGMVARRAIVRWSWRLLRRQWRSQVLIVALLVLAVSASVVGGGVAYNLAPAAGNAEFGAATHSLIFEDPTQGGMAVDVAAAAREFGDVDVIRRWTVPFPGVFEPVEFRSQDPEGSYTAPMLALLQGDYPTGNDEAAITDGVASMYGVAPGDHLAFAGENLTVVGVVENPSDLNDEFALLSPGHDDTPESATFLTEGSDDQVLSFRPPSGASVTVASRPGNIDVLATIGVLVVSTLALALAAMVAAAGFVVLAHRRLRQLGMLAAIGATGRNLRLVMQANGWLVGAVAAMVGAALGVSIWLLTVPLLEKLTAHRIDPFQFPWWLLVSTAVLSVVTAAAAAWLPAREVSRISTVEALSGRPPRPKPRGLSTSRAVPLLIGGVLSLVVAGNPTEGWIHVLLIVVGAIAIILGLVAIGPSTIGLMEHLLRRSHVAVRLAGRDLARHRSRSGAALGAISLALGLAVAIVLGTSVALFSSAEEGNLGENQLIVRVGEIPPSGDVVPIPDRSTSEIAALDAQVDELAASLGGAGITPVDVAVAADFDGFGGLPAVVLTEEVEPGLNRILTFVYVANEAILDSYGIDPATIPNDVEVLTVERGTLFFEPMRPELVQDYQSLKPGYTSLPGSFITPEALAERDWEHARAMWLLETAGPITEEQVMEVSQMAASSGITVEARSDQADLRTLRTVATAGGIAVALGVLAMTVGLLRSEAARELRTLTATGAPRSIRRTLSAATTAILALLGALLGTAAAYVGFIAGYSGDLLALTPIPFLHVSFIVIGLPLLAAGLAWLFAGREPVSLARSVIE